MHIVHLRRPLRISWDDMVASPQARGGHQALKDNCKAPSGGYLPPDPANDIDKIYQTWTWDTFRVSCL